MKRSRIRRFMPARVGGGVAAASAQVRSGSFDLRGMPAKTREFWRYILNRQGQEDVVREGGFLPLTPNLVKTEVELRP